MLLIIQLLLRIMKTNAELKMTTNQGLDGLASPPIDSERKVSFVVNTRLVCRSCDDRFYEVGEVYDRARRAYI